MSGTRALISNGGVISKLADEAMARYRLVEEGSDADHVKYMDAGTDTATGRPIGITKDGCDAAEDVVAIDLLGKGETKVATLNGTCSKGDFLTPEAPGTDAAGKLRTVPTATEGAFWIVGVALEDGTDEQEIAFQDCTPYLAGAADETGQLGLPSFDGDPTSPVNSQFWHDYTNDRLRARLAGTTVTIATICLAVMLSIACLLRAADKTAIVLDDATTGKLKAQTATDAASFVGDLKVNTDDFVVDIDGNITMAPTGGTVAVTGAQTVSSTLTWDGGITIDSVSETVAFGSFTDNTNTTGYIDLGSQIPAASIVVGWKAVVATGFTGDTTAVMQVGVAGDLDAYSADTAQSCLAAATVGSASLAATGFVAAATTPRVTVTGAADFTSISAGSMTVSIYYIACQ